MDSCGSAGWSLGTRQWPFEARKLRRASSRSVHAVPCLRNERPRAPSLPNRASVIWLGLPSERRRISLLCLSTHLARGALAAYALGTEACPCRFLYSSSSR